MSFSINAEFQSLLIFTTRNEREKGEENSPLLDDLEWHKMNSFQSSINEENQNLYLWTYNQQFNMMIEQKLSL
uniref:Candidate secreted effector n=1 Tax=Meloidogyne incognita TaxID=6306 RepID=A0A914NKQ5_MELIC